MDLKNIFAVFDPTRIGGPTQPHPIKGGGFMLSLKKLPSLYGVGLLCMALLASCTATRPIVINRPTTPETQQIEYDEDLSLMRPRFGEPFIEATAPSPTPKTIEQKPENKAVNTQDLTVGKQVDALIDSMSVRNRAMKYAAGYRIQIYVGNTRTDADAARVYTYQAFPELNPYMNFTAPTYRIRIGDFMTRLDAERYLSQVKGQFPSATIQPEKIEIRKSILAK